MAAERWRPGALVAARLDDGRTYHARLLEFPWVALYDGSDADGTEPAPEAITARAVVEVIAAHRDLLRPPPRGGGWHTVAALAPDPALAPPPERFVQDPFDPRDIQILDSVTGDMRPARYEEARGLPAAVVWDPENVEAFLVARTRGEPDPYDDEELRLVDPDAAPGR